MRDILNDHSRFEELCALEMVDQLSQEERFELLTHCDSCPQCEAWLSDAHVVSSHLLISYQFSVKSEPLPIGADNRFVAAAHRRGISLLYAEGRVNLSRTKFAMAAVVLVAVGIATAFSLHHAAHRVTQEAAARSEVRSDFLSERSTMSSMSAEPKPLNRTPLSRRVIPRKAKREARPADVEQNSRRAPWSQEPGQFQIRSVLFDFNDCCHFLPQKPGLVQAPDVHAFRTFPRFAGAWSLAASPARAFKYEVALLPIGSDGSQAQSHSFAFPSAQFPPVSLNLEHTRRLPCISETTAESHRVQ